MHVVRDGRDVVCSLLERGWLSAGRGGRRRRAARVRRRARASGSSPSGWRSSRRRATRPAPPGPGAAYVEAARAAAGTRTLELRYESIAADPAAAAARSPTHLGVDRGAARARRSSASTTARSAATGATSAPEQLADVEREAGDAAGRARLRRVTAVSLLSFSKTVLRRSFVLSDRQLRHRTTRKVVKMRRTLFRVTAIGDGRGGRGGARELGVWRARPRHGPRMGVRTFGPAASGPAADGSRLRRSRHRRPRRGFLGGRGIGGPGGPAARRRRRSHLATS